MRVMRCMNDLYPVCSQNEINQVHEPIKKNVSLTLALSLSLSLNKNQEHHLHPTPSRPLSPVPASSPLSPTARRWSGEKPGPSAARGGCRSTTHLLRQHPPPPFSFSPPARGHVVVSSPAPIAYCLFPHSAFSPALAQDGGSLPALPWTRHHVECVGLAGCIGLNAQQGQAGVVVVGCVRPDEVRHK